MNAVQPRDSPNRFRATSITPRWWSDSPQTDSAGVSQSVMSVMYVKVFPSEGLRLWGVGR